MTTSLVQQHKSYLIRFDDGDEHISWQTVDPGYELPRHATPVGKDSKGLIRPLTSFATAAAALAAFEGYVAAGEWARAGAADYGRKVRVYHAGVVQVLINPAAAVTEGLYLVPAGSPPVEHEFTLSGVGVDGLTVSPWQIVELPICPDFNEDVCSTPAAAADVSASTARGTATLGIVHARFFTNNYIPS